MENATDDKTQVLIGKDTAQVPAKQVSDKVSQRDNLGRFLKGHSGKPVGAISKLTRLKEDFFIVYGKMGSAAGLLAWAKEHPTKFYTMLFRLIPRNVEVSPQVTEVSLYEAKVRQITMSERFDADKDRAEIPGKNEMNEEEDYE